MTKRAWKYLATIIGAIILAVVAVLYFAENYTDFGFYSRDDSLYYFFTKIDYPNLLPVFMLVVLFMAVLDTLTVLISWSWTNLRTEKPGEKIRSAQDYWHQFRTVHLIFILLTIFLTIAMTTPSNTINLFTAIVSTSVLVANITNRKKD